MPHRFSECNLHNLFPIPIAILGCFSVALIAGCNPVDFVKKLDSTSRTAHERYAMSLRTAGLDSTAIGRDWLLASDSALRSSLIASVPLREVGVYRRSEARAVAYRLSLRGGQRFSASVSSSGTPARLYLDLFEVTTDTAKPFQHRASADSASETEDGTVTRRLSFEPPQNAVYILRLQPELLREGKFTLVATAEPTLAFPVEGGTNRSIQSFFGAVRDGGSRDHQGVDIFARRGTPALAATAGVVRSISPNNLGGKVVWLSDAQRSQSIYYAHLDSQNVVAGQRVEAGDTIGFVGNTGNARTTAPHLHFGIYRRGFGAVDPLPFIRRVDTRLPSMVADTARLGARGVPRRGATGLTLGPSPRDSQVTRLNTDTELLVMAVNGAQFRVQLESGVTGYIAADAIRLTSHDSNGR